MNRKTHLVESAITDIYHACAQEGCNELNRIREILSELYDAARSMSRDEHQAQINLLTCSNNEAIRK